MCLKDVGPYEEPEATTGGEIQAASKDRGRLPPRSVVRVLMVPRSGQAQAREVGREVR